MQEIESGNSTVPRWNLFSPDSIRIVNWNIDRGLKLRGVIEFLDSTKADIILLQEVDLNARRTQVWLEWALTDGEKPGSSLHEGGTYIHRNPTLSWYINDLPIGHPMGQNRRGPFVHVQHRFGRRFTAIGEWEDERLWRPTPVVGDRRRAMLYGAYDLRPDSSVALHLERRGGALGRDTLVELQGAYSF